MSEFIKAQEELRANLIEQIQSSLDDAEARGGIDAEVKEKIDRIEEDVRRADEAIAIAKRNEERKIEASVAAKGFVPAVSEERSANEILRDLGVRGGMHNFEARTLVPSTDTVPKTFYDEVYDVARLVGPMLDVAEVFNTTSGEDFTIPTLTAYSTATQTAAGSALTADDPTYSSITLGAYKYGLLVQVADELVTDAGFNIQSHLAQQAGNGLGFKINEVLTTGTGTVEPTGIITGAATGVTGTATDGSFDADDLIDLQYSLDGAARRLPGVAYMANGTTIGRIRRLKDDAGNFLYQVNVGAPDTFAGYQIVENPAMASVGSGTLSVAFGHLPSFKVRVAGGMQVATSTDYAFNQDVTTYRFLMRLDGALSHAGHVKVFEGYSA
jgi:HK97 family phage major capsid protein